MAQFDWVIRGGQIVSAMGCFDGDVAIQNGRISALGGGLPSGKQELDASGMMIMPGGVDPHAHIEQLSGMGVMNADTWESATRSAALGGTTSVISFAAQRPGERLRDTVTDYAARAARGAMIDHAWHLSICDTSVDNFAEDLAALLAQGHRSIKVFTTYNIRLSDRQIADILAIAQAGRGLVCVHAENDGLIGWTRDRLIASGQHAPDAHALSHPRLAEVEAIERICRFSEYFGQPVMIFHVSTSEGLSSIRKARGRGVPVRAETCPHYLLSTEDVLQQPGLDGAKWMCSPPQRTAADSAALWAGLNREDVSLVSSDHAPYRFDETGKLSAGSAPRFDQIANGLPGLEVRLPLMFDAMISRGYGNAETFVKFTSTTAADLYGLPRKGRILPGYDADLVIWDPNRAHTYDQADLHDNAGYNPWSGHRVTGWPRDVMLRGEWLVRDGNLVEGPPRGRWLMRGAPGVAPTDPAREAILTGALT